MTLVSALDIGGIQPDVGKHDVGEISLLQVGDHGIERLADARRPTCAHAAYAHVCATRSTFLVDAPQVTISDTAAITALSTRL